jgi:MATE family multidrug resistance protein
MRCERSPRYGNLVSNTEEEPTEYTSLLPKPTDIDSNSETYDNHESDKESWRRYLSEFWYLLKGSIPVILAYTLQNSLQTVSVLIVGRSSPENLATTASSLMFAMITAWMIALGGTTALDTLASTCFTGSTNKHELGILLQRGFFVLSLFYIPVAILWACSEPVFLLLGQEPQLSRDSARFLTCLIPGGVGYIYFELMKKYLQAQGKIPPVVSSPSESLTPRFY